ncbi:MAG: class I SAM-dependent methyltransferase [Streptomycetales bacterium]
MSIDERNPATYDNRKKAFRDRLYESYASTHAGYESRTATRLIYRRDIRPCLPAGRTGQRVLEIGCGQGELVRLLQEDSFDARGVDISPEQVQIAHAAGLGQIDLGDFHAYLGSTPAAWHAVVATDVLEHLDKEEVVATFDGVARGLAPGGVFVARVPNAVSPFGGHVMYGDLTHETWFTSRSVAQLAAAAGFASVRTFACPPVAHGLKSAARAIAWKPISGLFKLGLAAETGVVRGHIITQNLTFVARQGL